MLTKYVIVFAQRNLGRTTKKLIQVSERRGNRRGTDGIKTSQSLCMLQAFYIFFFGTIWMYYLFKN